MDRLQKKCVIASAGLHLLLLLIVVICPAFVGSKQPQKLPEINFVPAFLVDAAVAGGGNPNARPPQVNPKPPEPTPAPPEQVITPQPRVERRQEPEPVKQPEREVKPDPELLEASKTNRRRKPEVSTTPVVRRNNNQPNSTVRQTSDAEKQAQLRADRQRKAAMISKMAANIRDGLSDATAIADPGPGGGGPAYASYAAWVKTVYENAWEVSGDIKNEQADIEVKVTIARDGTVLSSDITSPSGDVVADRSVRRALDKVRTIGRPFPEGIKEKERTYTITFSPRAKRGLA